MSDILPMAPEAFPEIPSLDGVLMAVRDVGVKYQGRTDLLLVSLSEGTHVAGVFTQSLTAAAPVEGCIENLKAGQGLARAIVVNSGNANAFTGKKGSASVERVVSATSKVLNCDPHTVFTASTGVIGEELPDGKITENLNAMVSELGTADFEKAARAIMTTDTYPKGATRLIDLGGHPVRLSGICKGSGMIAPDMATMLGFVFTDAAIAPDVLQKMLAKTTDKSFNAITVDSDTSTSDTVLLAATGKAQNPLITDENDPECRVFEQALQEVMTDLAHQIVRDGEGASKFVTISLSGAENDGAAKKIALSVANSPLVKTAIAGEDANWGRIVMAVGKAGEKADRDQLSIAIGGIEIAAQGEAVSGYDETPVAAHMKTQDIHIAIDVGVGAGSATVWTCDLTHGYIAINADYRS